MYLFIKLIFVEGANAPINIKTNKYYYWKVQMHQYSYKFKLMEKVELWIVVK